MAEIGRHHPLPFYVFSDSFVYTFARRSPRTSATRADRVCALCALVFCTCGQGEKECHLRPSLCNLTSTGMRCCLKATSCRKPYAVFNAASVPIAVRSALMCAITPGVAIRSAIVTVSLAASVWPVARVACCALSASICLTYLLELYRNREHKEPCVEPTSSPLHWRE